MASLRHWYNGQLVTGQEMRDGDAALEQGIFDNLVDLGFVGVLGGGNVEERAGTPNLSVDVASFIARSPLGERLRSAGVANVSIAFDYLGNPTAVTTPGNSKYLDLYVVADRLPSDPRIDATNTTVYWVQDETFGFDLVQGTEAPSPSVPGVLPDGVLLARILITFGTTQVLNADINTSVRQDLFVIAGTPFALQAQLPSSAFAAILARYNNHVDGTGDQHAATALSYDGSGEFADGYAIPAGTVEDALDGIVNALGAFLLAPSGAHRLGCSEIASAIGGSSITAGALYDVLVALRSAATIEAAARTAWRGGDPNPAATVFAALDKVITDLSSAAISNDGITRIGAYAIADSPDSLSTGGLRAMLVQLLGFVNARARKASAESISGAWTFSGVVTHSEALVMSGSAGRLRTRTPSQLNDADQIVELSTDVWRIPTLSVSRIYTLRRSTGTAAQKPSGGERVTIVNRGNNSGKTITITSEGSQGTLLTLDGANYAAMTFEFDAGVALGGDGLGAWFLASSPSTGMTLAAAYPIV